MGFGESAYSQMRPVRGPSRARQTARLCRRLSCRRLTFGARKELVAEAQARIGSQPDKYVPYIYGLSQVGGASILYLANVPFDQIGLNMNLPETPVPEYTIQIMEKVPSIALGIALLAGGIAWWRNRKRGDVQESEQARE